MSDALKRDLYLGRDGDLETTPSGDLQTVSGAPNVAQAVLRRLVRLPGALLWSPDYGAGLELFVERQNAPSERALAATLGRRALKAEARLASGTVSVEPVTGSATAVQIVVEGVCVTGEAVQGVTRLEV